MPTATTSARAEIPPVRMLQILAAATCAGHAAAESQDTGRSPHQSRHKGSFTALDPRPCSDLTPAADGSTAPKF